MPFAPEASIAGSRAFENAAVAASPTQRIGADETSAPRLWRFGARAAPAATKRRKRLEAPRNRRARVFAKRSVDISQSRRFSPGYDAAKAAIPRGEVSVYAVGESRVAN
jgi:hypothetical protein